MNTQALVQGIVDIEVPVGSHQLSADTAGTTVYTGQPKGAAELTRDIEITNETWWELSYRFTWAGAQFVLDQQDAPPSQP